MLKKINLKEFKDLYRKHIIKDFPKEERPNLNKFKKRIKSKNENAYIYCENGKDKAYAIITMLDNYCFISFLAVYEEYRGEGIGTKLLKEISENFSNKKGIILEVESPQYAISEKDKIVREKRIRFYEKANYKIVENMEICLSSVMFNIMILNMLGTNIDEKEIANEMECFYKNIYKKYGKTLDFYIKLK